MRATLGTGLVAALLAGGALAGSALAGTPSAVGSPSEDPLERSRRAAEEIGFVGVVEVRWRDGGTERSERLTVQSAHGSLEVRGGVQLMAAPAAGRLVRHEEEGWRVLWPPRLATDRRPDPGRKYRVEERPGPAVAGRSTLQVDVRQRDRMRDQLREQLFLDEETGMLLRRVQFDPDGKVVRFIGFESLAVDPSTPAPRPPEQADDLTPEALPAAAMSASWLAAPEELAGGYRRLGAYRRDGLVQVLYSDGFYDLSVFEQPGRLDAGDVHRAGVPVQVGGSGGWRSTWPGGQVVLWQAGGTVFTVVSDAPVDQVLAAAADLPAPERRSPSLMERLRSVARTLIQPLG